VRARTASLTAALVGLVLAASGCTVAYDDDGEVLGGRLAAPPPKAADAIEVVVDTDLAPDDLVALAYLLRSPRARVLAITVPATGEVTCPSGVDLAGDLMRAIGVPPVPIACGRARRGAHGTPFPLQWVLSAVNQSGLERGSDFEPPSAQAVTTPAEELIGQLAEEHPGLVLAMLGPATGVAAVLRRDPDAYARIGAIYAMTGVATGPSQQEGIGEWNAAADPDALAQVLAGPVPVTVVPDEVVPSGPPEGTRAPVVGAIGVFTPAPSPKFWDTATAGVLTDPAVAQTSTGTWTVELTGDPGRLHRAGDGPVAVATDLDTNALDDLYREAFRSG
jgi:inosine-uridine nucleoside N-ribohydrolase